MRRFGRRFVPFCALSFTQQQEARRQFSPAGRRDGWEKIEAWAFPVTKRGKLAKTRVIEPVGDDAAVCQRYATERLVEIDTELEKGTRATPALHDEIRRLTRLAKGT